MNVLLGVDLRESLRQGLGDEFQTVTFRVLEKDAELSEALRDCAVALLSRVSDADIATAEHLRWVQVWSAGVEHLPLRAFAERSITVTNGSGAHGSQISENILGLMHAFALRLPTLLRAQEHREWSRHDVWQEKFDIEGQTLLIVGLGGIGSALAPRASALGMRVLGIRRTVSGPVPGVESVGTREQLLAWLPEADHVALCLPLTDDTTGFLQEADLRAMKPTAYVYNVGRGKSIDRIALLNALQEGWIAGAGLDVTDPEPLPADDPLWGLPNVILTQHTSGSSPRIQEKVLAIFRKNLRRYLAGESLINVVDPVTGY